MCKQCHHAHGTDPLGCALRLILQIKALVLIKFSLMFYLRTLSSTNFGLSITGLRSERTLSISSCGTLMCSKLQRLLHCPHNCARRQSCLRDGNNSLLRVRAAEQRTPRIGRRAFPYYERFHSGSHLSVVDFWTLDCFNVIFVVVCFPFLR